MSKFEIFILVTLIIFVGFLIFFALPGLLIPTIMMSTSVIILCMSFNRLK